MVYVFGCIYVDGQSFGNFNDMIKQSEYKDVLFIFNDNLEDFKSQSCQIGGGNAIIRPYQCLKVPRATGIPTGTNGVGFTSLDQIVDEKNNTAKYYIDVSLLKIKDIIEKNDYGNIFYSSDMNGNLGHGIFIVSPEVVNYISEQLHNFATNIPQPKILTLKSQLYHSPTKMENPPNEILPPSTPPSPPSPSSPSNNNQENEESDESEETQLSENDDSNNKPKKSNFKFYFILFLIICFVLLFFIVMKYFSK